VLASDRLAVVYNGLNRAGEEEVFGCVRGGLHRYAIGYKASFGPSGGAGIEEEHVAGVMVAYEQFKSPEESPTGFEFRVIVRDLRTGRVVHKVPTGPSFSPGNVGAGGVSALDVSPSGAAAWVRVNALTAEDEVRVVDGSGDHLVASGAGIARKSLRLSDRTLSWTQNGHRSTYTLR